MEWVDDGSLLLENGKLPFFLLDAHEELGTPGTLYLFGKVGIRSLFSSLYHCLSKPGVTPRLALPAFSAQCTCSYCSVGGRNEEAERTHRHTPRMGGMRMLRHAAVQVPVNGQHHSCCAVVENCQRCIFFVPQPGVFGGDELASLETQAAADPAQKLPLIRHLHVSTLHLCCQRFRSPSG